MTEAELERHCQKQERSRAFFIAYNLGRKHGRKF